MIKELAKNMVTQIADGIWNYGSRGAEISAGLVVVGTGLSHFFGGWDGMVQTLVWFMAVDFLLGFLAAAKAKNIDSQVMFWGGVNKVLVLLLVALGAKMDILFAMPEPYIRTAIIWFYLGREGLSLVENYGKMGLPFPAFVRDFLAQLKEKGDAGTKKEDKTHA